MTKMVSTKLIRSSALFFIALLMYSGCQSEVIDNSTLVDVEDVSFSASVLPILLTSCGGGGCHLGDDATGGVNLSNYQRVVTSVGEDYNGPIVIPGDGAGSPVTKSIEL